MDGRIVEGINTLEDKMRYNLIPPSDEFIAKLAEEQNQPYTIGVERDGENRFYSDGGKPIWPANNGAIGAPVNISLDTREKLLTRYGNELGRYVSPEGISFEQRALPRSTNLNDYHEYKVIKKIDHVMKGAIASWFGKPGKGIQYLLADRIASLINNGYLIGVSDNDKQ
ncbi:MAG: TNT domain-containing protein [Allisonella histaminiformans]|uniref:TNT domain-containing protein n=1 Tax=Allisonella histaminiformans TaxID=209880 RepID=UPI002A806CAE|nr:TNT domain-containing protein [Allisonella histaminiformans]MDY3957126.1 TNT domain-containing protein [Allisonella histaminiformans]